MNVFIAPCRFFLASGHLGAQASDRLYFVSYHELRTPVAYACDSQMAVSLPAALVDVVPPAAGQAYSNTDGRQRHRHSRVTSCSRNTRPLTVYRRKLMAKPATCSALAELPNTSRNVKLKSTMPERFILDRTKWTSAGR